MERGRVTEELSKLASVEFVGCEYCLNNEIDDVTLREFTYSGSALGPFTVKNAVVSKCPQCGLMYYSRSEAVVWELCKALELAVHCSVTCGTEVRFMREVLGLTISDLASMLGVNKSTVSRWEQGQVVPPSCGTKLLCFIFVAQVTNTLLSILQRTNDASVVASLLKMYRRVGLLDARSSDVRKAVERSSCRQAPEYTK